MKDMNGITDAHVVWRTTKINFQFLQLIFAYKFQNKTNIICCNLCNFSVFRPSSRTQGFGGKFKRIMPNVPIDTESVFLIDRIAAENKYLREGRENKQIIPSLIDVMTGSFYIVILFTKRFHGSVDFAFQTRSQSVCTE